MELTELLTAAGAASIVIILLQVIKPALDLADATWRRLGALIAITAGVLVTSGANVALAFPQHPIEAILTGVLAGASASGLYDAGRATASAVATRVTGLTGNG